jgi:DNA-binding beta-propeller fold protein YncE
MRLRLFLTSLAGLVALAALWLSRTQGQAGRTVIPLPTSKQLLLPVPGEPQPTNGFPAAIALSPDGRYAALLNNGYGTEESGFQQSIAVLDLPTSHLSDFPDARLGLHARQTYFLGLAFSADGKRLYASMASLTDPEGQQPGDTGNGIAVYAFHEGRVTPQRFLRIPLQTLGPGHRALKVSHALSPGKALPYPAGLAVVEQGGRELLLVADNLSDDALLLDAASGEIIHRFDLATEKDVPGSYPYGVVATRDGKRGYCSLWNASRVAELNLVTGETLRMLQLLPPDSPTAAGSHPSALLLSPDEKRLYVALANRDRVAMVDLLGLQPPRFLSTELPGERYGGTYPNALAQNRDGTRLFAADAAANAVAVFDIAHIDAASPPPDLPQPAAGFIPTEWYPSALAVHEDELLIATGKGEGTGPNSARAPSSGTSASAPQRDHHPYIATLLHGSIARVKLSAMQEELAAWTREVTLMNRNAALAQMKAPTARPRPIRHVIYIIKENRTYDQILGDLKPGNGDPSLTLYGEDITPNQHQLARQFGILDNFYCSGEVSGNGHVWSTAAITSDYTEKTWPIGYRSSERLYDYEGEVSNGIPLEEGQPDVNEPGTGYIWASVAQHHLSHRNYGEFIASRWCNDVDAPESPLLGTPHPPGASCTQTAILPGQPLPANVGQPHGSRSPWPWPVPVLAENVATKPELRGHFDPRFPDFNVMYPDQLRVDEFLNEFAEFVRARGTSQELPQFIILRLPNDHTAGTRPGAPRPAASVADNDLAVGRVVEAVSHSPYWDDTAILIVEDDAQDGPDHVDAHRSIAFVISKYAPGSREHPAIHSRFYTTVNMVRTVEELLDLPPMNNNDAQADVMSEMFSGPGTQPPYNADYRNRDNGLIYQVNPPNAPGSHESARMDFSRADAADSAELNAILWRDRKGLVPLPTPPHRVIPGD